MPVKTKVAVIPQMGAPFVIEECTLDDPKPNQVRVKILTTAICHSDIHSGKGEHGPFDGAATSGHEVCGIVDAIGENVKYVKPGDRVICCLVNAGCGECYQCIIGHPERCEVNGKWVFKAPGPYVRSDGSRPIQLGGTLTGFAEYANVNETALVKVLDGVPDEIASVMGCGFISGFGAVINRCELKPNESLAVMGCGGVGIPAIMAGNFAGAFPLIAIDTQDSKLEFARQCGATHTVNVLKSPDPIKEVQDICYGRGADNMVVAVAGIKIKRQAFSMTARTGICCFVGHGDKEPLSEFDVHDFLGGRRATGCAMGATKIRVDIPRFMELYLAGRFPMLDKMITAHYKLEDINKAFEDAEKGAMKNIIDLR